MSLIYQARALLMPVNEGAHQRAVNRDLRSSLTQLIEHARDDSVATPFPRNLGCTVVSSNTTRPPTMRYGSVTASSPSIHAA